MSDPAALREALDALPVDVVIAAQDIVDGQPDVIDVFDVEVPL